MDIQSILVQLKSERARLDLAINALEGSRTGRGPGRPAGSYKTSRTRRVMSPSARKRISEMMKKRWAERKRAGKA